MAENSKIEWCDHTFNPWIGCAHAGSPGCDHCYAERYGKRFGIAWGPSGERRRTSEANWEKPLAWNRRAKREGRTALVFCGSLCDVFEADRQNHHYRTNDSILGVGGGYLNDWRLDLFTMIEDTKHLTWLLLTKRPENIRSLIPPNWLDAPPANVWYGATAENQALADRRIPELLAVPAAGHFVSCEPLLGNIDLAEWLGSILADQIEYESPSWVIAGGESGPGARPSHPDWFRSLRDQCAAAGVPFMFEQWGDNPSPEAYEETYRMICAIFHMPRNGNILDGHMHLEFPRELRRSE